MTKELLVLFITGYFNNITWLNKWHEAVRERIALKYNKIITFKRIKIRFTGLEIIQLSFSDAIKGHAASINKLSVRLGIVMWRIAVKEVVVSDGCIRFGLATAGSSGNGPAMVNVKRNENKATNEMIRKLYASLNRKIDFFFRNAPHVLRFCNVTFSLGPDGNKKIAIPNFILRKKDISFEASAGTPGSHKAMRSDARLNGDDHPDLTTGNSAGMDIDLNLSGKPITIKLAGIKAVVKRDLIDRGKCDYELSITTGDTQLQHYSVINRAALKIDPFLLHLKCSLDHSGFYIDHSSSVNFNKLNFSFSFKHLFSPVDDFELGLKLYPCKTNEFLYSFPGFLNKDIYTAKFSGGLGFDAVLKFDVLNPVNFYFRSNAISDMTVDDFGKLDLNYLKSPFTHSVYTDDQYVRELVLNVDNPSFTPLENISHYLIDSIIFNEDRDYYKHKGIYPQGIGFAVIVNAGQRRFARGASTITMQLARNLFLNHKKNIYRKVEEMFLAWLLEEVFQIGKKRLLEIYLNIIEFGPGVYGITEAARFYFAKAPASLTLTESLVLTYVVPRPRFFYEALVQQSPQLFENLRAHLEFSSRSMLKKGLIVQEEFNNINYEVEFANGLGVFFLSEKVERLDSHLKTAYIKATRLWLVQYRDLPKPFITCTHRSHEQQMELYALGRTRPGDVVTHAKAGESPHNFNPSLAFDVAFRNCDNETEWSEDLFVKFAALMASADTDNKIRWGGTFSNLRDLPHFELLDWKNVANPSRQRSQLTHQY
jgi:hypothetical protein